MHDSRRMNDAEPEVQVRRVINQKQQRRRDMRQAFRMKHYHARIMGRQDESRNSSRSEHALSRVRGNGGRFVSKSEAKAIREAQP